MAEILRKQGIQDKPIVPGDPNPTMVPTADIKIGRIRRMAAPLMVPLTAAPQDTLALSPREVVSWVADNWQALGTGATIVGAGVGVASYIHRKGTDRERLDNQRFKDIVAGLGSTGTEAKAAVAVQLLHLLKTQGYEKFDKQIFQIAVNHFRDRNVKETSQLNTVDKAFLPVFLLAAFNVHEDLLKDGYGISLNQAMRSLNASGVHLDGANLTGVQLMALQMHESTFTNATLVGANLDGANFSGADLTGANLYGANLAGVNFSGTNLTGTNLWNTNLHGAYYSTNTNIYAAQGLHPELRQILLNQGIIEEPPPPRPGAKPRRR